MRTLELAQKKLLRIITHRAYNGHTSPIFRDLRLLKISDILALPASVFVYISLNGVNPLINNFQRLTHDINTKRVNHSKEHPDIEPHRNSITIYIEGQKYGTH